MGFYPYKPSEVPQDEIAKSTDKSKRRSGHNFAGRKGFTIITLSMNRRAPPVSKANSKNFKIVSSNKICIYRFMFIQMTGVISSFLPWI